MDYFDFDPASPESNSPFKARYVEIERANDLSWFTTEQIHPFTVILSTHSAGKPRRETDPVSYLSMIDLESSADRRILGGNMSTAPSLGPLEVSQDEKVADALDNIRRICHDAAFSPHQLHILKAHHVGHDTIPLLPLNVDKLTGDTRMPDEPFNLPVAGDFLYSYNPDVVLAARPADCPILLATADTPKGCISMLIHYPWRGVVNKYIEQTDACFDALEVDRSSLRMYLSPGAHAESFPYEFTENPYDVYPEAGTLFQNVQQVNNKWLFGIDTPRYVYEKLLTLPGIQKEALYADTSDTGAFKSGYSSHNRAYNFDPNQNTRDLLFMIRRPTEVQ